MAPRKKKLPFGYEEGEQYVSIVLKNRLRDQSASSLNKMARTVNFVWNYCNDTQKHAFEKRWAWKDKWLCAETLEDLTAGSFCGFELTGGDYRESLPAVRKIPQAA